MFLAVLFVVGGPAVAGGKDDAPGQEKKAELELVESETEDEESTSDDSEDSDEDSDGATEAEETDEESDDDDDEATREFRSSSADSGSSSKQSSDSSKASSSDDDEDDDNFVESAEDCPNEKNRYGEFTGSGANDSGAYNSTCDGRESENGNGGGDASGRPCMGCVGNADNKNPPGQFPDGSDANAGYECEDDEQGDPGRLDDFKGNNGVGKGNPAHTDCVEEEDNERKPPTCPDGRPMPSNGVCDEPVKRPPLPDVIKRPGLPPDRVLPRPPFTPPERRIPAFRPRERVSGVLPVTGPSQLLPFIWAALSMIAAGIAALATTRRRKELGARHW